MLSPVLPTYPYNLPCRYRFTCGNGSLRHVGVPRGQARAVIQQHLIAVAVVPAADQHRTAVGGEDRRTLRRGNIRAAVPGIAEGVHFPEVAGYISMPRQRPAQLAVGNGGPTAQGKQTGAHFLGKQLAQNVPLVLRKVVQICQRVHRFAADRDVQNVLRDRLRVRFVLGRFRRGGYFLHLGAYFVHRPKGVLNQLLLAFVYDDHIAVVV